MIVSKLRDQIVVQGGEKVSTWCVSQAVSKQGRVLIGYSRQAFSNFKIEWREHPSTSMHIPIVKFI